MAQQQNHFFSEQEGAPYDYMFKLVLIGDSEFKRQTHATIGVEFATHNVPIQDVKIRAQIWDTAGQERYRAITNTYYRQAIGVLLVYDISRRATFESIGKWLQEVRDHADEKVAIILVGNKSDLEGQRQVSTEEAQTFAQQQKIRFTESSALNASNVERAFRDLIGEVYEKMKQGEFADKLEQFNYFGNDRIRQQAMEQIMQHHNNDGNQGQDGTRQGGRQRAITSGGVQGVYRGADGKIYQRGQTVRISQATEQQANEKHQAAASGSACSCGL